MKALRFTKFGPPSVLSIEEIPKPQPGDGETLIQIKAAAINPSDVKNVAGAFPGTTLPRTPGRDFAGVVVGGGGTVGDEVWGSVPIFGMGHDGVQAEYVVVPTQSLSRKPNNLTMEQAAAVGVPFTTAWTSLIRAGQLQAGEIVLVVGAAGAVGQAATQIAKWKGARVLGADRVQNPMMGAEAWIDTGKEDLHDRVFALTEGKGANTVLDTVGGPMFEPSLRSLRGGGQQIAITSTADPRVSFNLIDFYRNRSRLIGVDSNKLEPNDTAEILNELRSGFESAQLKPPSSESVPFMQAIDAYLNVANGKTQAKQVLVMT